VLSVKPAEGSRPLPLLVGRDDAITGGVRYHWDGTGWAAAASNEPSYLFAAAFGPRGVAAHDDTDYYFSPEGTHFTRATTQPKPTKDCLRDNDYLIADASGFISIGYCENPMVWHSSDGLTWTPDSTRFPFGKRSLVQAVAASRSRIVAVGDTPGDAVAWTSADGHTWNRQTLTGGTPQVFVGDMGWFITGTTDADKPCFWVSADATTFHGPYPLPKQLREWGWLNIQMAIGKDTAIAIGPPVGKDPKAKPTAFLIRRTD
jgi:hypothetical protein